MNLKQSNKLETSFSLASMTDIVFQLLIFFMLTSSFVTPAALPINLPSSVESPAVMPRVLVTITNDLKFYVNDELIKDSEIEQKIKEALSKASEPIVVLNIDKDVSVQHLVKVASIINKLDAKVSIATQLDSSEEAK